ncbi:GNAT family N-acetyltransferase [Paenibacillus physcomitrellae]|uniref:Acetyltransferase n=1 Tax=Paenibacillus physcomitrellae TaxID=1619311 RepID=A0ABQ1FQI0_9BACL|nr:GNAT family N-acetyltransferase [Paenibacillus physcomitrellae]GGA25338.1 acetyltransferase [Paenibacillus physcomitrellae]
MEIVLEPVTAGQSGVLQNLMQFYFYDFTAYLDIQVEESGKFQPYPGLEKYYNGADGQYEAFLFRYGEHLTGFALVDHPLSHPDGEHYMAEFFVLKRFRRQGIGRSAAWALFDRYPGRWFISQLQANTRAQSFWRSTVSAYTSGQYREKVKLGSGNTVQFFEADGSR